MASARQGGHPSSPYGLRRTRRSEFRISDFGLQISKKAENRDSPVGAAFPPASPERERWRAGSRDLDCDFYDCNDLNDFYAFYGFYDFYGLTI